MEVPLEPGDHVNVQLELGGGYHVVAQLEPRDPVNILLEPGGDDHVEEMVEDALVVGECKLVIAYNCSHRVS